MSDDEDVPTSFGSAEEEARFWKTRYNAKCEELKELDKTFEEFQESSRDLEEELDRELEESKKRAKQVESEFSRYKLQVEDNLVSATVSFPRRSTSPLIAIQAQKKGE